MNDPTVALSDEEIASGQMRSLATWLTHEGMGHNAAMVERFVARVDQQAKRIAELEQRSAELLRLNEDYRRANVRLLNEKGDAESKVRVMEKEGLRRVGHGALKRLNRDLGIAEERNATLASSLSSAEERIRQLKEGIGRANRFLHTSDEQMRSNSSLDQVAHAINVLSALLNNEDKEQAK